MDCPKGEPGKWVFNLKLDKDGEISMLYVQYDLIIHQMDVKTAYLNANIDCNIYLQQPKMF